VHHQQECILEKVFQVCSIDGVVFDAPADKLWSAVGINGFTAPPQDRAESLRVRRVVRSYSFLP